MSISGLQENFIDTQDARLINVNNDTDYNQLTDLIIHIDSNVTKHQLTNDTVDNVFSLRMNRLEGNMLITTPEWGDLVSLTVDVDGVRPKNEWKLEWTDQSEIVTETIFMAQMKTLQVVDSGLGALKVFFVLEGDGTVTV